MGILLLASAEQVRVEGSVISGDLATKVRHGHFDSLEVALEPIV